MSNFDNALSAQSFNSPEIKTHGHFSEKVGKVVKSCAKLTGKGIRGIFKGVDYGFMAAGTAVGVIGALPLIATTLIGATTGGALGALLGLGIGLGIGDHKKGVRLGMTVGVIAGASAGAAVGALPALAGIVGGAGLVVGGALLTYLFRALGSALEGHALPKLMETSDSAGKILADQPEDKELKIVSAPSDNLDNPAYGERTNDYNDLNDTKD